MPDADDTAKDPAAKDPAAKADEAASDERVDGGAVADTAVASEENSSRTGRMRRVLRAVVRPRNLIPGLVIVVLAAATSFFAYQYVQNQHMDDLRTSAVQAARQYTTDLATYNYKSADANLDKIVDESTQDFGSQYKEVATKLQDLLKSGKGVATGQVGYVGLVDVNDRAATVIVFLDQHIQNVTEPKGRTDASRMVVNLVRQDGRWLLDGATPK